MTADNVAQAIAAFSRGEILVVTDDDDREGEADLVVAASLCTAEQMAFIVRHTSGIVCAPITQAQARELNLEPMVAVNDSPHTTAFTVSVDWRKGTTTGISASERNATCRALADPESQAVDFVRPGHVFPLVARDGGLLVRSGHTEAAVDLCKLAGLPPVGVICELVNDDGTVMKGNQVVRFAESHGLQQVSIASLIAWRQDREKLVQRVSEFSSGSSIGELRGYVYSTPFDPVCHAAYVYGDIGDGHKVLTRFHHLSPLKVFPGMATLEKALARFKANGAGVLICLGEGMPSNTPAQGLSNDEKRHMIWRRIGVGAQILRDLGIHSIRNLSSTQRTYVGMAGFGLKIVDNETLD